MENKIKKLYDGRKNIKQKDVSNRTEIDSCIQLGDLETVKKLIYQQTKIDNLKEENNRDIIAHLLEHIELMGSPFYKLQKTSILTKGMVKVEPKVAIVGDWILFSTGRALEQSEIDYLETSLICNIFSIDDDTSFFNSKELTSIVKELSEKDEATYKDSMYIADMQKSFYNAVNEDL